MKDIYMTVENGIVNINGFLYDLRRLIGFDNRINDKTAEELINKYHSYHMSAEKELWVILALDDLSKTHDFLCINLAIPYYGTNTSKDSIEDVYNWIDNLKHEYIKKINKDLHKNNFSAYNQLM